MKLLVGFFIVYLVALGFPVAALFNRLEPRIFGLPPAMTWVLFWVLLGWIVLVLQYRADRRDVN
jgi:hypothetical protein